MKYNSANMNTLIKSCLTLCLLWSAIGSHAQVIKKSDTDDSKKTSNQLRKALQLLVFLRSSHFDTGQFVELF